MGKWCAAMNPSGDPTICAEYKGRQYVVNGNTGRCMKKKEDDEYKGLTAAAAEWVQKKYPPAEKNNVQSFQKWQEEQEEKETMEETQLIDHDTCGGNKGEKEETQSITRYVYHDGSVRDCSLVVSSAIMKDGNENENENEEKKTRIPCSPASFGRFSTRPFGKVTGVLKVFTNVTHPDQPFVGCTPYLIPADENYIVIVSRGICAFEQKVWMAEKSGATGIIIGLMDETDVVFVMAGAGDAFTPPLDPKDSLPPSETLLEEDLPLGDHGTTIPAIMIDHLSLNWLQNDVGEDVVVSLCDTEEIESTLDGTGGMLSTLLDVNVTMGTSVGMTEASQGNPVNVPSKIKVNGPSGWGVVLSLNKGVEWQLGIVHDGEEVEL